MQRVYKLFISSVSIFVMLLICNRVSAMSTTDSSVLLVQLPQGITKADVIEVISGLKPSAFHWVEESPLMFAVPATLEQLNNHALNWPGSLVSVYPTEAKISLRMKRRLSATSGTIKTTIRYWGEEADLENLNLRSVGPALPGVYIGDLTKSEIDALSNLPLMFLITGEVGGLDALPHRNEQRPPDATFSVDSKNWELTWRETEYGGFIYDADCCESVYAVLWAVDADHCSDHPYFDIWEDDTWPLPDDWVYTSYWGQDASNPDLPFDTYAGRLISGSVLNCSHEGVLNECNEYYIKETTCFFGQSYNLDMCPNPPEITSVFWSNSSSCTSSLTSTRECNSTVYLFAEGSGFNACDSPIEVTFEDNNVDLYRQSDSCYRGSWTSEWKSSGTYSFTFCVDDPCTGEQICGSSNSLEVTDISIDNPAEPSEPSSGDDYTCGQTVRIEWDSGGDDGDCSGIDDYSVQIDDNSSFTSPYSGPWQDNTYMELEACQYPITEKIRHYWRVQTRDNAGSTAYSGAYRYFDIIGMGHLMVDWGALPICPSEVPASGGSYPITLSNNGDIAVNWQMTDAPAWVRAEPSNGNIPALGTTPVSIIIEPNPVQDNREGNIEIGSSSGPNPDARCVRQSGRTYLTAGNLKVSGTSILGSGPTYTVTGNINIGPIGGEFLLQWPSSTTSATVDTDQETIEFIEGWAAFRSIYECTAGQYRSFLSTVPLSIDCTDTQPTAMFSGSISFGSTEVFPNIESRDIDFNSGTMQIFSDLFFLPHMGPQNISCTVNLIGPEFSVSIDTGQCIPFGPLSIDTHGSAGGLIDLNDMAIQYDLDLVLLEIGDAEDSGSCIDNNGWVLAPLTYGIEVHVRYDYDDFILEFPERTGIFVPLPIGGGIQDGAEEEIYLERDRIDSNRGGYIGAGLEIRPGSYINVAEWDYDLSCDLSISVVGLSIDVLGLDVDYDSGSSTFSSVIQAGSPMISDFMTSGSGVTLTFAGQLSEGDYYFGLDGLLSFYISWGVDFIIDALLEVGVYESEYATSIGGELNASLSVLGRQFPIGSNLRLYSGCISIDGFLFCPLGRERADTTKTTWYFRKDSVDGVFPQGIVLPGTEFIRLPSGTSFWVDPAESTLGVCPMHINSDYHGINTTWELEPGQNVEPGDVAGVYASCGTNATMRLENSEGGFVQYGNDGFSSGGSLEGLDKGAWITSDGRKVIHLWSSSGVAIEDTFSLTLLNVDPADTLELCYAAGQQSSRDGSALFVEYPREELQGEEPYDTIIDPVSHVVEPLHGSGGESILPYIYQSDNTAAQGLSIIDIICYDNAIGDNMCIRVTTNKQSYCRVYYGQHESALNDSTTEWSLQAAHELHLADEVVPGWYYKVVVTDSEYMHSACSSIMEIMEITPMFLSYYELQIDNRAVIISWHVNDDIDASEFRLVGSKGNLDWDVIHFPITPGGFTAEDRSENLTSGGEFVYRLYYRDCEYNWQLIHSKVVKVEASPLATRLVSAKPNPFNPQISISFSVDKPVPVNVSVFDMAGRRVSVLTNQVYPAGQHTVDWDGKDAVGQEVAAGTYIAQMRTPTKVDSKKISLVR